MGRLTSDALTYSLAMGLARFPGFAALPFLTHWLSPAQMGILVTGWISVDLLQTLSGFGMRQSLARFLPLDPAPERKRAVLATALGTSALAGSLLGGIVLTFAWFFREAEALEQWLGEGPWPLALAIVAAGWTQNIAGTFVVYFKAEQRARSFFLALTGAAAAEAVVLLFLFLDGRIGILPLLWLESLRAVITILICLWGARRDLAWSFSPSVARSMFRYGIWLVPVSFFSWVTFFIDRVWMGWLANLSWVGIYGVYYRLFSPLAILFNGYIASLDSYLYAMKREEGLRYLADVLKRFVRRAGALSLFLAWAGFPVLWAGIEVFGLLPRDYLPGLGLAPLFVLIHFTYYYADHFGSVLEFTFRSRARLFILGGSALANFCLSGIAAWLFRDNGAAVMQAVAMATVLSFGILLLAQQRVAGAGVSARVHLEFGLWVLCILAAAWAGFIVS